MYGIALTGHRPTKLAGYNLSQPYYTKMRTFLEQGLRNSIRTYEPLECHSGLALGADTIWSQTIINVRQEYGSDMVRFVAHCPFPQQASKWPYAAQQQWKAHLEASDETITYAQHFSRATLQQRNKGMVDRSDTLVAIWDGSHSGTGNCVNYATKKQIKIHRLDPAMWR